MTEILPRLTGSLTYDSNSKTANNNSRYKMILGDALHCILVSTIFYYESGVTVNVQIFFRGRFGSALGSKT